MNKAPDNPLTTHVAAAPIERAQAAQQQPGADNNTVNMETQYTYSEHQGSSYLMLPGFPSPSTLQEKTSQVYIYNNKIGAYSALQKRMVLLPSLIANQDVGAPLASTTGAHTACWRVLLPPNPRLMPS